MISQIFRKIGPGSERSFGIVHTVLCSTSSHRHLLLPPMAFTGRYWCVVFPRVA